MSERRSPEAGSADFEDLTLARQCVNRDAEAVRQFVSAYEGLLERQLQRAGLSGALLADARQAFLEMLLVGRKGEPARLCQYRGDGPLAHWVRVAALRFGINVLRDQKGARIEDDSQLEREMATSNPELEYLERTFSADLDRAFRASLAELTDKQRLLLRQHYFDGLDFEALGKLYRTHRTTVGRWVREAQADLLERTRKRLRRELRAGAETVDSLLRQLVARMDVSIGRALG